MTTRINYSTCPLNPNQVSVIVGSLIQEHLGIYFYDNGFTRPAVSIQKPEENKRVEGLELVVDQTGISKNVDAYWIVQVLDRTGDQESSLALSNCAELFRKWFKQGGRVIYQGSNESIGAIARIIVKIPYGALMYWRARFQIDPHS